MYDQFHPLLWVHGQWLYKLSQSCAIRIYHFLFSCLQYVHAIKDINFVWDKYNGLICIITQPLILSVREDLDSLKEQFKKLKHDVLTFLERSGITAKDLCFIISEQPSWNRNLHFFNFLQKNANALANTENVLALFLILNTHWDFMNSDILGHITSYYHHHSTVNKKEAERLHTEYKVYENHLKHFLKRTTVRVFCEVEVCVKDTETPPHLLEIISKHSWYPPVYLEKVDKFRQVSQIIETLQHLLQ